MRFKPKNQSQPKSTQKEILVDKIDQELFIDEQNLNSELMDQPLLFRKYARLEAEAAKAVRAIELKLDRIKSRVHLKIKVDVQNKVTVKDAEALVNVDEEVIKAQDELVNAMEVHDNMKGVLLAFRQRHDALKDLAANKRKEYADS